LLSALVYLLLTLPLIGAYAMLAIGIVVIFRASRVLNLAHGAMAMAPTYLVYTLSHHHVPMPFAVPIGILFGAALGMMTERFFVRPLRRQGPTAQTVGTIAVFGVVVAVVARIYGTTPLAGPRVFPSGGIRLQDSTLLYGNIGLFLTAIAVTMGFVALFRFTNLGLALRGSADNRTAAALVGINPERAAVTAWVIGGSLAALAGILLGGVTSLSPYSLAFQMLPAFVAALMGGLSSLGGALLGAVFVGALTGLVPSLGLISFFRPLTSQLGISQLVLTVFALGVMYLRGTRYSSSDIREVAASNNDSAGGRRLYHLDDARSNPARRMRNYAVVIVLIAWPFLHPPFSLLGDAIQAGLYVIAASSIVLLTGWVGQISLAQATFVGVGSFGCAIVIRDTGLPFPLNLLVGGLIAGAAAALLGTIALRVRGLYLAVATLIFAYMADQYLFVAPWFAGSGGVSTVDVKTIGKAGTYPFFDMSDRRTFYFIVLAVAASVLFILANLRDSKSGRAFFAIRGSEMAAASLGIDVQRYKLSAFAVSGAIAGLAGNLLLIGQGTVVSDEFTINASLLYLAIAVVGGLQSLGGVVAASVLFAGLNELFYRVTALSGYLEVVSAALLAVVLLVYPGGLARIPVDVAERWSRVRAAWQAAHLGEHDEAHSTPLTTVVIRAQRYWTRAVAMLPIARRDEESRERTTKLARPELLPLVAAPAAAAAARDDRPFVPAQSHNGVAPPVASATMVADLSRFGDGAGVEIADSDTPILEARDIRVEFDGLVAVDHASLQLRPGQIVGLIGPNGAGKTTLFNAISGLVQPTSGSVHLFGQDVTGRGVHERAKLGLGRTFQAIQLFPQLTVYENLLVATHANNESGMFDHVALTRSGLRHEAAAEGVVRRVVDALGLAEVADRNVAGLPFGILRQVEIARTVVTGSPIVMLDEPASGLDNAETDRLSELLLGLRDELGLTLLLIEHDVRMVTQVSDYMYVLVYGKIVSEGLPADVRRDPVVTAAYLGEPDTADHEESLEAAVL
jgi:ABC-type branched-subunit amino acid transport system ATPase component/ABC-type branched-subunit amino acid transport system permease subunit